MSLLERRRSLIGAFKGFIRTVLGIPPISLISCIGDKDAISYKIYGNSIQDGTPTPDAPIEVESVGEKTVNLFDYDNQTWTTGLLNASTGNITTNVHYKTTDYLDILEPAKTYTVSFMQDYICTSYTSNRICYYDENKIFIQCAYNGTYSETQRYSYQLDVPFNAKYIRYSVRITDTEIQIEEGTTATDYEPYGKYKIPVKVSGKNLFNINDLRLGSNVKNLTINENEFSFEKTLVNTSSEAFYDIYLKAGTYRFSGSAMSSNGKDLIGIAVKIGSIFIINHSSEGSNKGCNFSFTLTEDNTYRIGFYSQYDAVAGTVTTFKNIQLEYGSVATKYEPYINSIITKNIFLNEPLRKIGNYADYIDFENSKVVRLNRTRKVTSSALYFYNNILTNIAVFRSTQRIFSDSNQGNVYDTINKCDKLKYRNGGSISTVAENSGEFLALRTGAFYVSFNKDRFVDGITEEKALEYLNNLNATVIYPLATPKEETIELPKLPTFKGTTVYSIDTIIQPSNMEVIYYSKERSV